MGRTTIYLNAGTEKKVREAAKAAGVSPSRWVSNLIREKVAAEWPPSVVNLAGAWADDEFPSLDDIRKGLATQE